MTELDRAAAMGFRESWLSSDTLHTTMPHFEWGIDKERWQEIVPLQQLPVGPHRTLRLDLQVLLNQNNGTFLQTNQIAGDIAISVHRNQKQAYKDILQSRYDQLSMYKRGNMDSAQLFRYLMEEIDKL